MRKWISFFRQYSGSRSISDFALIKLCIFASGLFFGTLVAEKRKKPVRAASLAIFLSTYVPLIGGFLRSASAAKEEENTEA
jgi:hypothetical protein